MPTAHRAIIERFVDAMNRRDWGALEQLTAEGYVEEYPQSGEVIRGWANARAVRERYPGADRPGSIQAGPALVAAKDERWISTPLFTVVRVEERSNEGTAMLRVTYPDRSVWWIVILYQLQGDLIAKATTFFAPVLEAPAWRAPWVELQDLATDGSTS